MWLVWLIMAVVMVVVEVFSLAIVALCFALGCLGGMVAALVGGTVTWQIIVVSIVTLLALLGLRPLLQRFRWFRHTPASANSGMDALIGRVGKLQHELRPGHLSRMRIDGDNWQVRSPSEETFPEGTMMRVTSYDSIILTVVPEGDSKNAEI